MPKHADLPARDPLHTHTYKKNNNNIYTHSICSSVHVHSKVKLNKIFFEILIRHRYLTFVKIKSKGIYNVNFFFISDQSCSFKLSSH